MKNVSGIALLFLLWQMFAHLPVYGQISPGELSKPHTHLEGLSNCTKCHDLGKKVSNQKCLDCHTEIKNRISAGKGYHSSAEVKGKECVKCHSDHHGLNFQIIRFDKTKFNHDVTGYKLTGAHALKTCTDCHKSANITDPAIRKKKMTYLGLTTACLGCHTDYHQKSLSQECGNCHDFNKFKPATGFDHSKARFKLNGMHQQVSCASCHKITTRNGQKYQEFTGLKFDNCVPCHTDAHEGKFGTQCRDCHTEQSFRIIKGKENFDHSRTNFKLEGRHIKVTCESCHKVKFSSPSQYDQCRDCHKDYHEGQFEKPGKSTDCADCHTVAGFQGSTYDLDRHNSAPFLLKGAHLATPCIACHKKDTKWNFRNIGMKCIDCHTDIHSPAISGKYYPGGDCRSCHNENRWNEVSFDHNQTKFPLTGAHSRPSCRSCHFKPVQGGKPRQEFAGLAFQCADCHSDQHQKQFDSNGKTDCANCHNNEKFIPATGFDHARSRFPLDGKHKAVACARCHPTVTDQGSSYVLYKTGKIKCEDCHQ